MRSHGFGVGPVVLLSAIAIALPACNPRVATEDLPDPSATIEAVGRRLGRSIDPVELTEASKSGDRVLQLLNRSERDALGRDAIRFRVDRPTVVTVVAPARSVPFWLADRGFVATGEKLRNPDGDWAAFRKTFPSGTIGLGVNALDGSSPAHYAVFLRGEGGDVPIVEGPEIETRKAEAGVSPFVDAHKPFDRLPEGYLGSTIVLTRLADRADGAIASGRVWKSRQPSSPRPDQVVVSFGDDPTRSLSISWRTDLSLERSAVRIARDGSGDSRIVDGDSHPVESAGLLNDPVILRHRVRVDSLEPDSRYVYEVGDGSPGGWSPSHKVRTAPSSPRDFRFLYLGDAQNGLERWGDLIQDAHKRHPDAGFLILAGDLVDRGNERSNWDHFFLRSGGVFGEVPFLPAVGNHEYLDKGPRIYRGTFDLPRNGPPGIDSNLVYSFEYSDAFVAVLDSNLGLYDPALAKRQADWLDEKLSQTRATWKFVTFHHPIHASHTTRENPELAAAWAPVFDKHHVDLVLQGHDHAYLRTHPMKAGRRVGSTAEGTVYVVSVSGEKFYDQDPRGYTAKGFTKLATYQVIDVKIRERTLTYRSFDRDGREVDSLVIQKPAATNPMAE